MIHFSLQKKLHTSEGETQLNINCDIKSGEFVSLYGSSGVGKTSVLRMLAGFMKPENGVIKMNDEIWFDHEKHVDLIPQHRKIGFVFQDYALFPNMSVKENISFSLVKGESKDIVDELLELTGLLMLSNRKIQTLSGGQQQRVALARAIAKKPKLLLLDEPLSAIDNVMREQLQDTLLQLHNKYELTTILVSHDIEEIVRLSDKIIHLEKGAAKEFETTNAFLNGFENMRGLSGNILSVINKQDNNSVNIFVRNRVISVVVPKNNTDDLKNGDRVNVVYGKNAVPSIHKL